MCYLIAKNNQGGSSLAIQMMHGKELAKLKQKLLSELPGEDGWMQYGNQVAAPLSEPVCRG